MSKPRESDLYPPIKAFLTEQGYEVKGEVGSADVVAMRADDPPVIVELKLAFSLTLFHQGLARLALTDHVYLAVAYRPGAAFRRALKSNVQMARRLGLGVITVRLRDNHVVVHAEPGPYAPRKSKVKQNRLRTAFDRMRGDPNAGGATRHGIVTGYRQDAIRCARHLAEHGPSKGAEIKSQTGIPLATRIMADNHYGWFSRVSRGVYTLTDSGRQGLVDYADD